MLPKVLVVDDMPDNVKLLALDLEDAGYEVLTATNGNEALRIMRDEGPPIVLTDWMMPEMDGIELCKRMRTLEGIGFVYVIMITAHTDQDRLVEAFEAGVDDYLSKPIQEAELKARLGAGVRIIRLEEDLEAERRSLHKANAQMAVLNDQLQVMATTDELTGLWNRREAIRHMNEQWATSCRHDQPFACIAFDIDHFKKVNDTYGHDAGDAVLRSVAETVNESRRSGERAYRIGGEEFLILCPSATAQQAALGAERIRTLIADQTVLHNGLNLSVTVSLGVSERTPDIELPAEMLRLADEALYESKHAGRDRVSVAQQAHPQEAAQSLKSCET